jgi:secretion/DNA translocation related CpaE-like protein
MDSSPAALVSSDSSLIHLVQASAATSGSSVAIVSHREDVRELWRRSSFVLIGSDMVEQVSTWGLPRREQVFLVGSQGSQEVLCRWSAPLAASIIRLPEGAPWLSRVISGVTSENRQATVVAVRSGAGGVGVSTLCVGLALGGAAQAKKVALIDADPYGGGVDLLMGAENNPGWRWDKLRNAVGQIADISSMLPRSDSVTLVSMERKNPSPIPPQAFEAVVDCLARSHHLVIIDAGRVGIPLDTVSKSVVVTTKSVRALAATRLVVEENICRESGLVVRQLGGSLHAREASRALGLPLIGVIPQWSDLPRLADRGIPPHLSGGWKKICTKVLNWSIDDQVPPRGKRALS